MPPRTPKVRAARQLAREATGRTEPDEYGGGGPPKKRMPGPPPVIRYGRSEDSLGVLTFGEAAKKLAVDRRQVESWVEDGTLVAVSVGLARMVSADQVDAVRKAREARPPQE